MLGDASCRLLLYVFGYLFPAYSCFKALQARNETAVRDWCIYWLLLAVFTTAERLLLDWLIFWLPLYYEAKFLFVLYLWHPKTQGAKWLYRAYLRPFLAAHEPLVDDKILEARSWLGTILTSHFHRLTSVLQSRALIAIAALQSLQQNKIAEVEKRTGEKKLKSHSQIQSQEEDSVRARRISIDSDSDSSLDLPSVPLTKID